VWQDYRSTHDELSGRDLLGDIGRQAPFVEEWINLQEQIAIDRINSDKLYLSHRNGR
jgi:hypothetical protein